MSPPIDVLPASSCDPAIAQEYFDRARPLLVKGGAKDLEMARWTLRSLEEAMGDRRVRVMYSSMGKLDINAEGPGKIEHPKLPVRQIFETITSPEQSNKLYWSLYPSLLLPKPLWREVQLPMLIPPSCYVTDASLFVGGKGLLTPLHYDYYHNAVVQIRGRKQWTLFSPEDGEHLYPTTKRHSHCSQIFDIDDVDHEAFPLFRRATPHPLVLEAGDVLLLPKLWWHTVRTLETSLGVHFWFGEKSHYRRRIASSLAMPGIPWVIASRLVRANNDLRRRRRQGGAIAASG